MKGVQPPQQKSLRFCVTSANVIPDNWFAFVTKKGALHRAVARHRILHAMVHSPKPQSGQARKEAQKGEANNLIDFLILNSK